MPPPTTGARVMAIVSLGGLELQRHLRGAAVRCQPAVLALDRPPRVSLDPFPDRTGRGVLEAGWVRLTDAGGAEVARRRLGGWSGARRWDDLDVLAYAATTMWTWLVLPLVLGDAAVTVRRAGGSGGLEVELPTGWPGAGRRHVLHLDAEGRVHRHEEGELVHELSGHCDFGGVELATARRTRRRDGRARVGWGDVVAAHWLGAEKSLN